MRAIFTTTALALSLGGCGSTVATTPFGAIVVDMNDLEVQVVDSISRSVTSTTTPSTGVPFTLSRTNVNAATGFDTFRGGPNAVYYLYEASDVNGSAYIMTFVDAALPAIAFNLSSPGGSMPVSGTARYAGQYVGFLVTIPTDSPTTIVQSYIAGDVGLNADFGAATISGSITNRVRTITATGVPSPIPMEDVQLRANSIANGQSANINSATEGGRIVDPAYISANGQPLRGNWQVIFGGDQAASVMGEVVIGHNYLNSPPGSTSDDYSERGVFKASRN